MMIDVIFRIITESWLVLGQMSPYLLFGFVAAGVMSVCLSAAWVQRHLGGRGLGPVIKASIFGVPLPLCSCSVIPVAVSMHKQGAGRAATTAFLLSTPQTGVDSIAVTYALLGPVFAVFRPVAALLTGLAGGALVKFLGEPNGNNGHSDTMASSSANCCSTTEPRPGVLSRILRYGLVTLPRDIGPALLVGVLIAGTLTALVPQDQLAPYIGGGVLSILLMMLAGVPIYVCATASVPIAAGLMHLGASPGTALAFLIAGPATNAATFTTIWKVLGRRTAVLFLVTVGISALGSGLLLDWLMPMLGSSLPDLGGVPVHSHVNGWFHVGAVLLLVLLTFSYLYRTGHDAVSVSQTTVDDHPTASPGQSDPSPAPAGGCCCHVDEDNR